MNRYKLTKAGINVNEGLIRFNNDADLYEEFLSTFISDTNYDNMITAINNKDIKASFFYAHSLKGLAGNLSLASLFDSLIPLVESLRSESFDDIDTLLEPINTAYNNVINVLS